MHDIKIKIKPQETIKSIDKSIVGVQKIKNNLINTKEKINEMTIDDDNNSGEEYAEKKVQNQISYISRKGIEKGNEIGKKSLIELQQKYTKEKQKINTFKSQVKEKRAKDLKNVANNIGKAIKNNTKKLTKATKTNTKITSKNIKTAEQVTKNSQKLAKENIEFFIKKIRIFKKVGSKITKNLKIAMLIIIKAIKSVVKGVKSLIFVISAGGLISAIIILIITLIGGIVASIFNNNEYENYESAEIQNSEIVLVAKAQIGNEGGDKFWRWYGFEEHVSWCACFVSWCANECGYIDRGIIPKFSVCDDGISWFKENGKWKDRGESYLSIVGDIIFFDWKDENGNQDGISDHVGIVEKINILNRTIYTIEGNTDDTCAERVYSIDDIQIMGYGIPKYE